MKKVLLTSTAVAAFVAFSSAAVAQDPGQADYGATEGGGGSGSAFTVKTNGAVKFYLKYSGPNPGTDVRSNVVTDPDDATKAIVTTAPLRTNAGFFTIVVAELEFNGGATTDNGTDISFHIDLNFSGHPTDTADTTLIGSSDNPINVGNIVRSEELSLMIAGGWGSVEMGHNDGAEDTLKTYGGSVAAGTGGINGDLHGVDNVVSSIGGGGQAGGGDSGDSLKITYRTPVFAGVELGYSLGYATNGPGDTNGGTLGHGMGIKYSGKGGGVTYAVSLVYGDTTLTHDGSATAPAVETRRKLLETFNITNDTTFAEARTNIGRVGGANALANADVGNLLKAAGLSETAITGLGQQPGGAAALADELNFARSINTFSTTPRTTASSTPAPYTSFAQIRDAVIKDVRDAENTKAHGSIGAGAKVGIGDFSAGLGITYNNLGVDAKYGTPSSLAFSAGVAYALPDAGANVSLTGGATDLLNLDYDKDKGDLTSTGYQVVASADYAVLPGVTIATDLGYGDSNSGDDIAGGVQWLMRVKAAF